MTVGWLCSACKRTRPTLLEDDSTNKEEGVCPPREIKCNRRAPSLCRSTESYPNTVSFCANPEWASPKHLQTSFTFVPIRDKDGRYCSGGAHAWSANRARDLPLLAMDG